MSVSKFHQQYQQDMMDVTRHLLSERERIQQKQSSPMVDEAIFVAQKLKISKKTAQKYVALVKGVA